MYDFMELFAPHLSQKLINRAMNLKNKQDVARLFEDYEVPAK
jgi:hypothetical protein